MYMQTSKHAYIHKYTHTQTQTHTHEHMHTLNSIQILEFCSLVTATGLLNSASITEVFQALNFTISTTSETKLRRMSMKFPRSRA